MRLMTRYIILFVLCVCSQNLLAQHTNAPLDKEYYHLLDRYEIKNRQMASGFHSAVKPGPRQGISALADSTFESGANLSRQDIFNLNYLKTDNWEFERDSVHLSRRPFLKYLYRNKADLFHVQTPHFRLHMRPVLHFVGGKEKEGSSFLFVNTRGMQIHGSIDDKVGFYSVITENQAVFPAHVREWTRNQLAVPYEGFWKGYKEQGVDYLAARGYISAQATRHINVQFGYDKNFIGNGYRSLILSDFSNSYAFLKLNTRVWRFNYTNLFTEMRANVIGNHTGLFSRDYPKKYMAFHHLSFNFGKNFNLGVFEAIVFGHADSLGTNSFELSYLNPVIFYRALEHQGGSADNALLGADMKWNFARHFSLYGQVIFDELVISEFTSQSGWWGNKYGAQLGLKYIDVLGIPNLDLQLEGNMVRPFTYSHSNLYLNYAHYHQPLAHPLGANFREVLALLRYQPIPKLNFNAKILMAQYGSDAESDNWGGDIFKDYGSHQQEYDNQITQGIFNELLYLEGNISFQFRHNLFIDLKQAYRTVKSEVEANNRNSWYTVIAFRLNTQALTHDF
jgi:hypothetical protein